MQKQSFIQNLICLVSILFSFGYLLLIYKGLPDIIPIHFDLNGVADNFGNKAMLWLLPILLPFLTFVIMTFLKSKNEKINEPRLRANIKMVMTLILAALTIAILAYVKNYMQVHGAYVDDNQQRFFIISYIIGILFMVLGIILFFVKPNAWIGIRNPWTLTHSIIWKKTNITAGKLLIFLGLVIASSKFLSPYLPTTFLLPTLILFFIFYINLYSFLLSKKFNHHDS